MAFFAGLRALIRWHAEFSRRSRAARRFSDKIGRHLHADFRYGCNNIEGYPAVERERMKHSQTELPEQGA